MYINKSNLKYVDLDMDRKSENDYVVKKGDTLWSIAKRNSISVEDLMKINNLKSNLIKVGQILSIPNDN